MASNLMQHRMVRRPEVEEVTGLSRATLYRLIGKGLFPSPVKLGPNSVGWRESVIREWLEGRETVGAGAASTPGKADEATTSEHPTPALRGSAQ